MCPMNANIVLTLISLVATAILFAVFTIKPLFIRVSLATILVAIHTFLLHGLAVAWERMNQYGAFTAQYRNAIDIFRQLAEKGQHNELASEIIDFDQKTRSDPQSAVSLSEAVSSIKTGSYITGPLRYFACSVDAPDGLYQITIFNSFTSESEKQPYLNQGNALISYTQRIRPHHEFLIPGTPEAVYEVVISPIGDGATLGNRIKDVRLKAGANIFQITTPIYD
jgi:hypothetical protein